MDSSAPRLSGLVLLVLSVSFLQACGGHPPTQSSTRPPLTPDPPAAPPSPQPVSLPPTVTVDVRTATLTGANETPQVVTQATGRGAVVVDSNTHEITGGVTFANLTPAGVGILSGAPGTNGSASLIELTLQGTDTAIIPPGRILSASEYAAFRSGTLYFNVRTAANPAGEIRGQLTAQSGVDASVVSLSGTQEIGPTVSSSASGKGTLVVDSGTHEIVIGVVAFSGIDVSPNFATLAQIQIAPVGANGAAVVPFTLVRGAGFATAPRGATLATDSSWYTALLANGLYFNVASNNNQGGEVRGQIQVDPQASPPPPPPPPANAPTLTTLQNSVFNPICTRCHGGNQLSAGMSLEAGRSFASLVNVPSSQDVTLTRVIPGNASDSLLIHKLEDPTPPVGQRMPLGSSPLSQTTIDMIQAWIDAGAANN